MADTRAFVNRVAAHPTIRQFLRFASVGIVGTVVHYGVMAAFMRFADAGPVAATTLGFLAGASVSYVLNRRVTFITKTPVGVTFVKYIVALGVGAFINAGIVALLHGYGVIFAQLTATGVVLFWNFGASRLLVFRE